MNGGDAQVREYLERLVTFVTQRVDSIRRGFVLYSLQDPPRRRRRHTTQPLPTAVLDACGEKRQSQPIPTVVLEACGDKGR